MYGNHVRRWTYWTNWQTLNMKLWIHKTHPYIDLKGELKDVFCGDFHDDVIKLKPFPRYWPFMQGIHRSPANSPHKGQWRGTFMFSLIFARINRWVNTGEAGDLRRYRAHYDVIVMWRKNDRDNDTAPNLHIPSFRHGLFFSRYTIM